MMWKIVTLCTCLCTVSSISVPSWEPLRMMLHEKLEDIYQNDKSEVHKKLQAGKYFKHYLSTEPGTYKVRIFNWVFSYLLYSNTEATLHIGF